jgi:hypothetical protein
MGDIVDNDVDAVFGELKNDGFADPRIAASDDRDLVL